MNLVLDILRMPFGDTICDAEMHVSGLSPMQPSVSGNPRTTKEDHASIHFTFGYFFI